jgi:formylglycine-generating enzyme required for sulfatase activity
VNAKTVRALASIRCRFGWCSQLSITIVSFVVIVQIATAQTPVICPAKAFSAAQIVEFVIGKVPEARLMQLVKSCGVSFIATEDTLDTLRAVGLPNPVLDFIRIVGAPSSLSAKNADETRRPIVNPEIEFVRIPAGEFMMGGDFADELPKHHVQITKPFEIGKYEVTQAQWQLVTGTNPSQSKDPRNPVDSVSVADAERFLDSLNSFHDGFRYRLPTEAEWEYAARGGQKSEDSTNPDAIAWYEKNSGGKAHPVGEKRPNGWGLYDILGNVAELCQDWYLPDYYRASPESDPMGPAVANARVIRGGSWATPTVFVYAARREWVAPGNRDGVTGIRLVREPVSATGEH